MLCLDSHVDCCRALGAAFALCHTFISQPLSLFLPQEVIHTFTFSLLILLKDSNMARWHIFLGIYSRPIAVCLGGQLSGGFYEEFLAVGGIIQTVQKISRNSGD